MLGAISLEALRRNSGGNLSRSKMPLPTTAELRLLEILWQLGEGTVEDLIRASGEKTPPNYKTVQTLLRIMERKKLITHSVRGRAVFWRHEHPDFGGCDAGHHAADGVAFVDAALRRLPEKGPIARPVLAAWPAGSNRWSFSKRNRIWP